MRHLTYRRRMAGAILHGLVGRYETMEGEMGLNSYGMPVRRTVNQTFFDELNRKMNFLARFPSPAVLLTFRMIDGMVDQVLIEVNWREQVERLEPECWPE